MHHRTLRPWRLICSLVVPAMLLGGGPALAGADPQHAGEVEVIAVEDITTAAACVLTAESFFDKAQTQLIQRTTNPCPPGSVLHAERMTKQEAEARGLPYVISTGNPQADEAAVDKLKWSLLEAIRGPAPEPVRPVETSRQLLGSCGTPTYRTRYLSYNAEGGTVQVGVQYHDVEDSYPYGCDVILIYQTFAYLSDALNSGEDLFWDQEYYDAGINAQNYDMGCREFIYGGSTLYTYMNWFGYPNYWFTDESINDTSVGCEWWGEEYTGAVVLDG